jgi:hypothetical protein
MLCAFLFCQAIVHGKGSDRVIGDELPGIDRIDVDGCRIRLIDSKSTERILFTSFGQPRGGSEFFFVVFRVEERGTWFRGIDPRHGRDKGRVIVIIVPEGIVPSVRVIIERTAAEVDGALDLGVIPQGLNLPGQLGRVAPGGIGTCPVRRQSDIALPAVAMAGPPVQQDGIGRAGMAELEIDLRDHIIDPAVLQPEEDIGIEVIIVGLTAVGFAAFRVFGATCARWRKG